MEHLSQCGRCSFYIRNITARSSHMPDRPETKRRQTNYFAVKNMFANFTGHIDKHGECKFILEYESGKFNWKRMSGHLLTSYSYGVWAWDCCLFYSRGFPEPVF